VTVAVPTATPVKVTEQLPVADRMQLVPTVPTAVFDETKVTVPDGVFAATVVSVTVAVQLEVVTPTVIEAGVQATLVDVLSIVGVGVKTLAISARLSGTAPPVPPLVIVAQVFRTLVPVQTEPD
jgi:hypothetical protein